MGWEKCPCPDPNTCEMCEGTGTIEIVEISKCCWPWDYKPCNKLAASPYAVLCIPHRDDLIIFWKELRELGEI